jgi:hypothetical protein
MELGGKTFIPPHLPHMFDTGKFASFTPFTPPSKQAPYLACSRCALARLQQLQTESNLLRIHSMGGAHKNELRLYIYIYDVGMLQA